MTDREYLRYLMEQEQAEAALRDVIEAYRKSNMPNAMALRGIYLSYVCCGFNEDQALLLTMRSIGLSPNGKA